MEKIRGYELSKAFGIPSKEIVKVLHDYNVSDKNHMSALSEYELDVIFEYYTQKNQVADFSMYDNANNPQKQETETTENENEEVENTVVEVTRKVRTVDTRVNTVDLDRIDDEKIEELIPDNVKQGTKKQKINQKKKQKQQGVKTGGAKQKPTAEDMLKRKEKKEKKEQKIHVLIPDEITVGQLAERMRRPATEVIKKLMLLGIMASVNETIDFDTASLIVEEMGGTFEKEVILTAEDVLFNDEPDTEEQLKPRSPVVVVMGHVDHGKTSLLDTIRNTNVTDGEFGGITQHIGAHRVRVGDRKITFLDTPGHEAFTAMRARGAHVTDIAVLVVAADDGVMPQTIEAINHAKAAEVPIIVAVNKCDKPGANPDKVLQQLTEHGLVPEAWGGETITVNVSALQGTGIDELLEYILLVAEVQDLKANPKAEASGVVIEANLDKGKGPVATLLVQNGTLRTGNCIVVGTACGRVRALLSDSGERIVKAEPSTPVEVLGLTEVPNAGDFFEVVKNEKEMKAIIEKRKEKERNKRLDAMLPAHMRREAGDAEGDVPQLNLIIKANTHGSAEAVSQAIAQFESKEIVTKIIHVGVGDISEADVMLASASNALILGFTVKEDSNALAAAEREGVTIKKYDIIYQILEDIEKTMISLLSPEVKEITTGQVEIRQIFTIGKIQKIAGCYVTEGKINRNDTATIYRDGKEIFKGAVDQLKRFKDDVKEVAQGFECGLSFVKFNDIQEGDIVKFTTKQEIERSELE